MAKAKPQFLCTACGANLAKWSGQCPECRDWNTVREFTAAPGPVARHRSGFAGEGSSRAVTLASVAPEPAERIGSGVRELDRVLGGGLVPGSVVLVGGDPGIGKSTLLLQVLAGVVERHPALYVTGEESLEQIALRAGRLGLDTAQLQCLAETSVDQILEVIGESQPALVVIDSIQTLHSEAVQSAPGSVSQVRDSAAALVRFAKERGCCVLLVGHVTKEGSLAGPRVLEHMVDAVLYFENDSGSRYRIVRSVKNRFGTVNELGIFAMTGKGLKQVANPSAIFLSGNETTPGSVVTVIREGTRPLLVELQALADQSQLATPRRVAIGLDPNRVAMLLAVLNRHGGANLADQDVFINIVGGIRVAETCTDLPALLAILSSFRNRRVAGRMVCFGEVGLAGEIRPVFNGEERLREAAGHGFQRALVPVANRPRKPIRGLEVIGVETLAEAVEKGFD